MRFSTFITAFIIGLAQGVQPLAHQYVVPGRLHLLQLLDLVGRHRGVNVQQPLGRRLLDHLASTAREAGATQLFLEVRPSNAAALALYARAGFETIGRRKGYYPAAGGREDALVMRLPL